jgi:short-subunit dehydrogenase
MKKTILITGASSGFGKDAALALAQRGHKVIASTHKERSVEELKDFFKQKNINVQVFKLDITLAEDRQKVLNYDLDVLINNAGTGQSGSLAEIPLEKIRADFETNVFSSIAISQLALKKMIEKDNGTIIFVSSLAGRITMPFLGSYAMTKFALSAGAEAMRAELHRISKNIHVSLIEPGAYHTGFNQENIAKKYTWMNEGSYFYKMITELKKEETRYFKLTELKSNKSIVKKFIQAAEAKHPRLRYSAPWWQYLGVQVLRIFGK